MGRRLRRARKAKGLTQKQLAHACGVTKQSVSRWECGAKNMRSVHLFCVARTLGYNSEWIALGTGDPYPDAARQAWDAVFDTFPPKKNKQPCQSATR